MKTIKEIIEEHGFMPDGDLYDISEIVIEECVEVIEDAVLHRLPASTYADLIRKHFGLN